MKHSTCNTISQNFCMKLSDPTADEYKIKTQFYNILQQQKHSLFPAISRISF